MSQKAKLRLFVGSLVLMLILSIFLALFYAMGAEYAGEIILGALIVVSIYFIVLAGLVGDEERKSSSEPLH